MQDKQNIVPSSSEPVTYAIGDIHGEVTLLRQLLAMLPYREQDTLVFLGDYMDRGEDSVAAIRALRDLQRHHHKCVFLRGNHDDMWLECWDGLQFFEAPDIEGADKVWQENDEHIPFEIGDWLAETVIDYEDEHAYYVHAGLIPDKPIDYTSTFTKLWGVHSFLLSNYNWGKKIVFGHWQLPKPLIRSNKIGIDTGAYKTGILTAIRLPDYQIFQTHR